MKLNIAFSLAFLAASSAVGLLAQEADERSRVDAPEIQTDEKRIDPADQNRNPIRYRSDSNRTAGVSEMNKASKVIGMEVKNHLGELLGEIQDVVIDLPSGRVSYVVLSVGGFLGIGEKYIAVPPSAFQAGSSSDKLVLHVEKAKVLTAPGFPKTEWPDFENPDWGATAEWAKDPAADRPGEGSGTLRIDREKSELQTDTELRARHDEKALGYRGADRTYRERGVGRGDDTESFRGQIVSVNIESRTFTVTGDSGTRTFELAKKPILNIRSNRNPSLIDFKPGYGVAVGYHKEGDRWIAHSLIRTDPSEVR